MNYVYRIAAAVALATMATAPVQAGWKLIEPAKQVIVAKSTMKVTPGEQWNRWTYKPVKKGEVWTLDGVALNELYFVSGLIAGETIYRETNKKDNPLPKFRTGMQLTDIPELFESSNRVVLGLSTFTVSGAEPFKFGAHDGIKFSYEFTRADSALTRKGVAVGTIVQNKLHLISYTSPSLYYFDRDRAKAEAIMASVTL
jgi:hypothetical protein